MESPHAVMRRLERQQRPAHYATAVGLIDAAERLAVIGRNLLGERGITEDDARRLGAVAAMAEDAVEAYEAATT